jgi:hypothetical protein
MPIETLTRAGATSLLGAREFVHPQDAWPAEEHSDTFCHRALGAPKGCSTPERCYLLSVIRSICATLT